MVFIVFVLYKNMHSFIYIMLVLLLFFKDLMVSVKNH